MRKKAFWLLLVAISVMGFSMNVYAEGDVYYTTKNGIELNQEEYEFLTKFYWPGYPDVMTREQYNQFVEDDLVHSEVTIKTKTYEPSALIGPGNMKQNPSSTEAGRTLQIGAACLPTKCIISLNATWNVDPTITSWDVIGSYLYNVSLKSYSHTYVSTLNTTTYFSNLKTESDGLGNSVYLPEDGANMIINMGFTVSRGGTVYGSYQHAMQDTTLANSQLYNIDISGYGHVFDFYGTALGVYDQAGGVDIDV